MPRNRICHGCAIWDSVKNTFSRAVRILQQVEQRTVTVNIQLSVKVVFYPTSPMEADGRQLNIRYVKPVIPLYPIHNLGGPFSVTTVEMECPPWACIAQVMQQAGKYHAVFRYTLVLVRMVFQFNSGRIKNPQ